MREANQFSNKVPHPVVNSVRHVAVTHVIYQQALDSFHCSLLCKVRLSDSPLLGRDDTHLSGQIWQTLVIVEDSEVLGL